ncbi:MAG: DUF1080 domain-containing protein [Planctomycetota bacterium]
MSVNRWCLGALALVVAAGIVTASRGAAVQEVEVPRVVQPGQGAAPPADAVVLFDGTDLSGWTKRDGSPAGWKVEDGVMVAVRGEGAVLSEATFQDVQLHLEFATPTPPQGDGQGRGNSGVYLQGRYEVQVLDSYENETYPNGQCGAIYGHHPPLVNACRKPGEWQAYDIVFRAARFDDGGAKTADATLTVFHNGVLIQDHAPVPKSTAAAMQGEGPDAGPLFLQDHGNPVRYRNVWMRRL